ncbi:MAG: hypothetical protein AAFV53_06415 [Myxococcota bacterium]
MADEDLKMGIEAAMDANLDWIKGHYATLLSDGPPTGDYTQAMRDALLLLIDMRLPGVPDIIIDRIQSAERDQLLVWSLQAFERGGLFQLCAELHRS